MAGLLVASSDPALRSTLVTATTSADLTPNEVADTGAVLLETLLGHYGLVVLDDRLPGMAAADVVRELARRRVGVLVITADTSELNQVLLMELGADDVVGRPFSTAELRARVHAIWRRRSVRPGQTLGAVDVLGPVCVDPASRMVTVRGRAVHVAPLEFAVLLALQSRDGAPVSRDVLLSECWPLNVARRPEYVDTVIRRLRLRLELKPSSPRHVVTIRKLGYALHS